MMTKNEVREVQMGTDSKASARSFVIYEGGTPLLRVAARNVKILLELRAILPNVVQESCGTSQCSYTYSLAEFTSEPARTHQVIEKRMPLPPSHQRYVPSTPSGIASQDSKFGLVPKPTGFLWHYPDAPYPFQR